MLTTVETMVFKEESDCSLRQAWPSLGKTDLKTFQLMFKYLQQFSLESLIISSSFDIGIESSWITSSGTIMKLPQMTIDSLELRSLLRILNVAKTKPGKRLFKVWMFNPITIQTELDRRLDTVEFLSSNHDLLTQLTTIVSKNPYDFETVLTSAINQRIPQDRFKLCLSTLSKIGSFLKSLVHGENSSSVQLPIFIQSVLDQIIKDFTTLPKELLEPIGGDGDEIIRNEHIDKLQNEIEGYESELENHKKDICKLLGLLSFHYSTISGLDYLIEVRNGCSVPSNWSKISATQKFIRYRSPLILETLPKIQWLKEQLQEEAKKSWKEYLFKNVPNLKTLLKTIKVWATLDVIIALATISQRDGFCRPKFNQCSGDIKVLG